MEENQKVSQFISEKNFYTFRIMTISFFMIFLFAINVMAERIEGDIVQQQEIVVLKELFSMKKESLLSEHLSI